MNGANEPDAPHYLPTYEGCYVCGQSHPRGLRIRFYTGGFGRVCARFAPDGDQTGYRNIVHGGVISALLDELLGWPIALQTGRMALTAELTVRFRKPMPNDSIYLATAYPGVDRGRYWEGTGDIRDDAGILYAKAQGKYFLISAEGTAAVAANLTYRPGDAPVFRYGRRVDKKTAPG
jgi:acyl-coenzyme A thioesterase PaaI-like protein